MHICILQVCKSWEIAVDSRCTNVQVTCLDPDDACDSAAERGSHGGGVLGRFLCKVALKYHVIIHISTGLPLPVFMPSLFLEQRFCLFFSVALSRRHPSLTRKLSTHVASFMPCPPHTREQLPSLEKIHFAHSFRKTHLDSVVSKPKLVEQLVIQNCIRSEEFFFF